MELNVLTIADRVGTESDAYELLEELRWNGNPVCPHCDSPEPYFLRPSNGESRRTRHGSMSERRVWKCRACRKQFSVLTNTIFHGSHIPIRTWLLVIFEMCSSKNGVAAREVERKYDLTPKSAWFMLHRIREAMKREPLVGMLRGVVIADETYIGGAAKNRHHQGKSPKGIRSAREYTMHDKPAVLSLLDKETGEVRSHLLPRVDGANLRKVIAEQVDMANTVLHTDQAASYNVLRSELAGHETVDHSAWEYVRKDGMTTNHVEGFFSQLKRSLDGTHHRVSVKHLPRYLAEFDFRYSSRKVTDSARMNTLMGRVGDRRLSYKPLRAQ